MERLIEMSRRKLVAKPPKFKRYLSDQIDWAQRLIVILGHRGTGKTTLMLQHMHESNIKLIYLSLDDYWFEENRLVELIEQLYLDGYRNFYLDEVHRYAHWSSDLKTIYDNYPDSKFIVSGSSILELSKGKADLSRRSAVYHLAGLSFREFINLEKDLKIPELGLKELLDGHQEISEKLSDQIDILALFQKYLEFGYYPFYQEGKNLYKARLLEITNLVLEIDIAPFEELTHKTIKNMKKLIFIISESVPFIPNISKIAEKLEVSRNTILKTLDLLEQAQILNLLRSSTQGVSYLQKPEKIYLQNTNLAYAISSNHSNSENIRETFFLNQVLVNHQITSPKFGDFMVNSQFIFEVGGPTKTKHQIEGVPNAYIASDGIKSGAGSKIPLWMFGLLY
jgi:predicted AAA+ superfamily ATPase